MIAVGCAKGFKHFTCLPRGREEVLISVYNHDCVQDPSQPEYTDYLLGCYARYQRPYVWLRSNFSAKTKTFGQDVGNFESPLKLVSTKSKTTSERYRFIDDKQTNMIVSVPRVFEVIIELVRRNSQSYILNPFEIDFALLQTVSPFERVLLSAALIDFLKLIYVTPGSTCSNEVSNDLQGLIGVHFAAIKQILPTLPVHSSTLRPAMDLTPASSPVQSNLSAVQM
eukprot:c7634_g1_i1.p1 GENE.c7634_g1_i1~~c7634_g1_i1.p1  ORF type:complete len:225 (-),score=43.31 c7634_g1_i1:301-975(-)